MFENAEIRKKRKGNITYWENGVMVGKRCTKCGKDKEIDKFYLKDNGKRRSSHCDECCYLAGKKRRDKKDKVRRNFINDDGIEVNINGKGAISYFKNGEMIGRRCIKCNKDKEIDDFKFRNKKKGIYNSVCKECSNLRDKEWRENNIEKIRENDRKRYKEKKEYSKEYSKKWREKNKEKVRERKRNWKCTIKKKNIQIITDMLRQINPILKEIDIKAYGCIYKITGLNNHNYIGQTTHSLSFRYHGDVIKWWIRERKAKQNQKFLEELQNEENFTIEIIDIGICQYHLNKLESYYIDKYDSYNNGYNNNLGHYKSDDGLEEFNQILSTHNLEYKDGKIIKKPTSTNEID